MDQQLAFNGHSGQRLPPPNDRSASNSRACRVRRARIGELLEENEQLIQQRDFLAAQLESLTRGPKAAQDQMGQDVVTAAPHGSTLIAELARQVAAQSTLIEHMQREIFQLVARVELVEEQAALPAPGAVQVNMVQPAVAAIPAAAPAPSIGMSA